MEGVIRARAEQLGIGYEEMEKQYLAQVSLRRMVSPHDVAAMVAVPAVRRRREHLRPVARRRRQCRDALRTDRA